MDETTERPKPSRRCPICKGFIQGEAVLYDGREYCSSDCAIDEFEIQRDKERENE